jgi:hypothetical protein
MPTRPSKKEDVFQAAARIVEQVTGEPLPKLTKKPEISEEERKLRSQAASILGRLGGSKGGNARALNLSAERRKDIASKAAQSRWKKTS